MFTILLHTTASRPSNIVTLRTDLDWSKEVPGIYQDGAWRFELSTFEYAPAFEFKFQLNRAHWKSNRNLRVEPVDGGEYPFTEGPGDDQVEFEQDPVDEAVPRLGIVEDSAVARGTFKSNLDENHLHDVIIIGSGVGGGVLAEQLTDLGRNVLVLETGSYLFPTHVGNLPRLYEGQYWGESPKVIKNIWSLWHRYRIDDDLEAGGTNYGPGGQGYYLGGRGVFWGGYIPRMDNADFEAWPARVQRDLESIWYEQAETLLRKSTLDSDYQRNVVQGVNTALHAADGDEYEVSTLAMAIDHTNPLKRSCPGGVFSPVELLLEAALNPEKDRGELAVNLNHHVLSIEQQNNRAPAVLARDMISRTIRRYRGRVVVLCGGSVGSARIALASRLADPYAKIGKGITDHPILFTHFRIPGDSPFYQDNASAKVQFRHKHATSTDHRFIGFIDVGSEMNQARFSDPELKAAFENWSPDFMLAEVVFQMNSPLNEENWVGVPTGTRSLLRIGNSGYSDAEFAEMSDLKTRAIAALGGDKLDPHDNLELKHVGGTGVVAHEVGSLRMKPNGVVDEHLRFHAIENLYACDLSVFPSSPAANPTLTLAALALRLADHIDRSLY